MTTSGAYGNELQRLMGLLHRAQLLVTLAAIVLVGGFAILSIWITADWVTHSSVVALLLIGPMFYQEYARRVVITTGSMRRLFAMACTYALVILGVPALCYLNDAALTEKIVVASIALASVAAFAVSRTPVFLRANSGGVEGDDRDFDLLRFGGWSAASSLAYSGYNFAVQAILAAIAGPSAVGAYAAVRTLTQPVGTLIQAIDTVDKPRAGRAYAERGINGLWVVIRKSWAWLIALSLPYLVAISYFSSEVLAIAYGDRYADVSGLVVLWSAVMLVMLFTQPLETGLYVIRRPDLLFKGRAVSAVLVLSATPFLISAWSASGALSALILGWSLAGLFAGLQLIAARTAYKK
jgi:O-antigen/teichoic acid export membrane protein